MNDCCCGEGGIACNDCSPSLNDTYSITSIGYPTRVVDWSSGCTWTAAPSYELSYWSGRWHCLYDGGGGMVWYDGPYDPCEPTGVYTSGGVLTCVVS